MKYRVRLLRDYQGLAATTVEVEAPDPDKAVAQALAMADDITEWTVSGSVQATNTRVAAIKEVD